MPRGPKEESSAKRLCLNELRLLLGTVKDVSTKLRRDRKPYIQGFLHTQSGESWEVLWWEVDQAPKEGSRVRLRGEEKVYEGRKADPCAPDVHVGRSIGLPGGFLP